MTPSFEVPAQYFYALIANLPTDVDVGIRYRMVVTTDSTRVVDNLHTAIDAGVISTTGLITPEQAARRLASLGTAQGTAPVCNTGVGSALVTAWLAYTNPTPTDDPVADIQPFWDTVLAPSGSMALTNPTLADGHLQLIVCAIVQAGDPTALIAAVRLAHTLNSVKDLDPTPWGGGAGLTYQDWLSIFQASPGAIPPFAQIGTAPLPQGLPEQTSAFVRRLAQFFNIATLVPTTPTPVAAALPQLDLPLFDPMGDPISGFLTAYQGLGHAGYAFGQALTLDDTTAGPQAAATVFPTDPRAAAWLLQAADAINALDAVTKIAGVSDQLRFSLAESLYARGLTSAAQIALLTQDQLTSTLIGTPACPFAGQIATNAGGPASPTSPPGGPFGPINDGTLANCVPPPWLSPLGPVAYLHELLLLPESASCARPTGDPNAPKPTLGDAVASRRGPIGQLLATRANLETGLPMVDLVNECLETLVADSSVDTVYQTSDDSLAGHPLGPPHVKPDPDADPYRHDPEVIFAALPEHSSLQAGLAGAYAKLRNDFTACVLPYPQSLDVCRSYLRELDTSRFATMRRFRKDITEFVFDPDPAHLPVDFATYRWRYPVRIEIARERLGISPEEYVQLFSTNIGPGLLAQLYGFPPSAPSSWMVTVATLSEFLRRTCLSYCEFVALWQSGFVPFKHRVLGHEGDAGDFPLCEPCYLDKHVIVFAGPPADALARLAVFIRLWRKLRHREDGGYSFTQLADIASVLQLFTGTTGSNINPDFVRQLAAFQMMRIDFDLPLINPTAAVSASATGADRTHLLALFAGPSAAQWSWAVGEVIEGVQRHARAEHAGSKRPSDFIKLLASNLDPLSSLAGFDPSTPTRTWNVHPTHALRFAEVLAKICAARFTVGELLYLFTVRDALDGDDPFPLPTAEESADSPLDLPDDAGEWSLWSLRQKLLDVEVSDEDARSWTWARIEASLREEFGFVAAPGGTDPVVALGRHFFPDALAHGGTTVHASDRQYRTSLLTNATSPNMWNNPDEGPFHYDNGSQELWIELPLPDEEVFEKLARIRPLSGDEQKAVQDLYFKPRIDLAPFAFLFPSFGYADHHLIQEGDQEERWVRFRRSFARTHARCRVIAHHLAAHVAAVAGDREHEGTHLALRLLRQLAADENGAVPPARWESDKGAPPPLAWTLPSGGAFAAILGLLGTGLLGELRLEGSKTVLWRELRGPIDPFGRTRDEWNVPAPMVIPSLGAGLGAEQAGLAAVRNGIAVTNAEGRPLGGVQGHCVHWHGVLLVERAGPHEFFAGAHTPGRERPDAERARKRRWRVTLRRGQKAWIVLAHDWAGEEGPGDRSSPLPLKRGAYEITVELERPAPSWDDADDVHPLHTGLELKYVGPDTDGHVVPVPLHRLFVESKTGGLGEGLDEVVPKAAKQLLDALYTSSLRDVRRTYQRAFKALLWARRLDLSAKWFADWGQSEVGHLLDHADAFEGISFYGGGPWTTHRAYLDLDFLPVVDPYAPPASDDRAKPSIQRQQALFDQWERLFDYTRLRDGVRRATEQPLWLLFDEATESPTEDPRQLLRHLGVNASYAPLVLAYDSGYSVATSDLVDERWPARVWRARAWLARLEREFLVKNVRAARPDLWASDDPGTSGGNDNLTKLVQDSLIEQGQPRRYEDLKRLDDGLRERARRALVAYLCGPSGAAADSPKGLTEMLLIDVEAGLSEHASRIEEAVTAVQTFVERARMGLESWQPSPGFLLLWDTTYRTFCTWQKCKKRQAYRENWVECEEHEKASRTEAFRFLEVELRRATLTVPEPGGLTWWDGRRPPEHPTLKLLQAREPATMVLISDQPEALNLLGTPERSARRSWLASIPGLTAPPPPPNNDARANVPGAAAPAAAVRATTASAAAPLPASGTGQLPFWIEAAIRLGVRFLRIAAAGVPPASDPLAPRASAGHAPCCKVCGRRHDAVVDEYYFWLVDGRYSAVDGIDASGNNPALQDANANWNDDPGTSNGDLPKLLAWAPQPNVYLMWARMHDGELQQPRRSTKGLAVTPGTALTLQFDGRKQDSLYFTVIGAAAPPPGYAATPNPGFRYDLPTDSALVVPQVTPDPTMINVPVPNLPAYPYFAYFAPGAPLAPLSMFSESIAVACTLRTHCRFEAALDWYEAFYDPLGNDVRWCWQAVPQPDANNRPPTADESLAREGGLCCRYSVVTDDVARDRAIVLDYLETLVDWGDANMRGNAPEAFQMARLRFDTAAKILGPRPITVLDWDDLPKPPPTVTGLSPLLYGPPLNPRLLALYDRVADRLGLIHYNESARRLRNGRSHEGMRYWTDDRPFERSWRGGGGGCCETCGCNDCRCADERDWCCLPSPYRFTFLVQKALELANEVRAFGAALLSAFEKGDAEYLAYVRAIHERQLTERALEIREDAWRAADWDVQALEKARESAQNQLQYYSRLVEGNLNGGELDYQSLENGAIGSYGAAIVSQTIATIVGPIPDLFVGENNFTWLALGNKMAAVFTGIAQISSTSAQIQSTNAQLRLTQAGWDRRLVEWQHQVDQFTIQVEQVTRQILAAQRRRDSALHELNNTRLQIEQSREVLDFLRDKFTGHALYLFLQKETAALHREMFELALRGARHAERAFNFERGYTSRHFVDCELWRDLREGLLSGEHLVLSLRRMEKCYADENVRVYELTKHISLRQLFPHEFLLLKLTGRCEIELPEWLFDLDYPGQFMRRIKNVALTIPCVAGPYVGVHCRLTLLSSATRIAPWLLEPVAPCCKPLPPPKQAPPSPCGCWSPPEPESVEHGQEHEHEHRRLHGGYLSQLEDPRIVRRHLAKQAIATSSGQNDGGMFELNFRDERYLPFEFEGAVSRWRIELPAENNYFDMDTLSDVVLHLNYTSWEGGDVLRHAAQETAESHLPDEGRRVMDVRQELADEWRRFHALSPEERHRRLELPVGRDTFMFLPGHRDVWITRLEVFFQAPDADPGDHHAIAFVSGHKRGCRRAHEGHDDRGTAEIACVVGRAWPGWYHGVVDVRLGPLGWGEHDRVGALRFGRTCGRVERVLVVFGYEAHAGRPRMRPGRRGRSMGVWDS
jgi:hypothetical protein